MADTSTQKILKLAMGTSTGLSSVQTKDPGRILFVTDTGKMLIDVDQNTRVELNAYDADYAHEAGTAAQWKNSVNFSIASAASDSTTVSVNGTQSAAQLALPKTLTGLTSITAGSFIGKADTAGTADKTKESLTIKFNGTTNATFDGSSSKSVNITPASIGALPNTVKYAASDVANGAANSVKASLKFGNQTYNGSQEKVITAADLGLSNALHFIGVTTTGLTSGSATPSGGLSIGDESITTFNVGDVVISGNLEYVYVSREAGKYVWEVLGNQDSYALKTITVTGTGALDTGSSNSNGALDKNVTIIHKTYNSANKTVATSIDYIKTDNIAGEPTPLEIKGAEATGTLYIPKITVDTYGHITYNEDTKVEIAMPPSIKALSLATSTTAAPGTTSSVSYDPSAGAATFTIYKMKGATLSAAGYQGLVPAPPQLTKDASQDTIYTFLASDGTWKESQVVWGSF